MYRHCESRKARGNLPYCFLVKLVSLVNLGIGASLNSLYSLFSLNSLSLAPKLFSYCKFSKNSPTITQLWKIISKFALQSSDCRHIESVFRALNRKCGSFHKSGDQRIALISCIYAIGTLCANILLYTGVGHSIVYSDLGFTTTFYLVN